jgi:hypothetical protein
MAQDPYRARLTYHDLVLMPEDGRRHEIVDGDHLVTPSPETASAGSRSPVGSSPSSAREARSR